MEESIPTQGKSTLLGFQYRILGVSYMPHALDRKRRVQVSFFRQQSPQGLYLLCLSDVPKKKVTQYKREIVQRLGELVDDTSVAHYAVRSFQVPTYEDFKEVIQQSLAQPHKPVFWEPGEGEVP